MNSLPGVVKSLEQLGFGICDGKEKDKTTQDDDDYDDIDLFGSDDEADSEAEKIKEQRLKVRKDFFNGRDIFQFRFNNPSVKCGPYKLWLIYIAGSGFRFQMRLQTKWIHGKMNFSHCMELDSDEFPSELSSTGMGLESESVLSECKEAIRRISCCSNFKWIHI